MPKILLLAIMSGYCWVGHILYLYKLLATVNQEIFVYENIHVLNIRVNKFQGCPMKIF